MHPSPVSSETQRPPGRTEFQRAISDRSDRWFAACLAITRRHDLAEDALQDALLSAWQKREQFQRGARLDTWIHRIAINAALALLRKQKPALVLDDPDALEGADPGPDVARADAELETALKIALHKLSDTERICFVLKHLEQWRLAEIAEELDMNVSRVKQALFRGVRKLKPGMTVLWSEAS